MNCIVGRKILNIASPLRDIRIFFSTAAIIFLLSIQQGCGQQEYRKVADLSCQLADKVTPALTDSAEEVSSIISKIYIDHSESMKGFVNPSTVSGRNIFTQFIESMGDVLPGCQVYRYGQPFGLKRDVITVSDITFPAEIDNQLRNPNSYSLEYNPDDILLTEIALNKQPAFSVIVTDGVESDSQGKVNTKVVGAIRGWLNQGKIFAILQLRSEFSGRFYSERLRRMIGNVDVAERPFYAFVFSPNKLELDNFLDKLKRHFPMIKPLIFSDDSITSETELPEAIDANYASEQPPDKPYYWQMISTKNLRLEMEDFFVYKFIYKIKPTYPLKQLGLRFTPKVIRYDEVAQQFAGDGFPLTSEIKLESEPDNNEQNPVELGNKQVLLLKPRAIFEKDKQGSYNFYMLEQTPFIKDSSDEIAEWSTRDDSTLENVNKTYRFQELILALLDVHLKDRLMPRISPHVYLTVANK